MSLLNLSTEAEPLLVYAYERGGRIYAMIRAADEATLDAVALYAELLYRDADDVVHKAPGIDLIRIGPMLLTAAVLDADGNETTAATFDPRFHANIIVSEPALSRLDEYGVRKVEKWLLAWTLSGQADGQVNAAEEAKVLYGVSLINPETIADEYLVVL